MQRNQNLGRYDFRYNFISDYGVMRIVSILEVCSHVYDVEIPERISTDTLNAFKLVITNNSKSKKGKGRGGKKKKGKK